MLNCSYLLEKVFFISIYLDNFDFRAVIEVFLTTTVNVPRL